MAIHAYGASGGLSQHLHSVAQAVIDRAPVVAGIASLEDACHALSEVHVVPPAGMQAREAELLNRVRAWTPSLPVQQADLLIVDKIGKNISGTGMDTNVTGRCRLLDLAAFPEPTIGCVVACSLTAASQGNVQAQHFLGDLYESGAGVAKDLQKARDSYLSAAEAGLAQSQN